MPEGQPYRKVWACELDEDDPAFRCGEAKTPGSIGLWNGRGTSVANIGDTRNGIFVLLWSRVTSLHQMILSSCRFAYNWFMEIRQASVKSKTTRPG